jgi:drug/metabolite transporter (DMT)-like permease
MADGTDVREQALQTRDSAGEHGDSGRRGRSGLGVGTVAFLAGGMACFGSATPVSSVVGEAFPVWLASALRMAVAAAVLVPALALRARSGDERPVEALRGTDAGDRWLLVGIAVVGTFLFSVAMVLGMRRAPGAVGAVVMATTPAVTALGAVVVLRERLGRARLVAVALALAGVVLVNAFTGAAAGAGRAPVVGSVLVFVAVCCEAAYSLMGKRLTAGLSPLVIATVAAVVALVAFLPVAAWQAAGFDWGRPDRGDWLAVAWWGAGTMALGSWLWFQGMRRVAGGTAAAFMGVMPVSALVGSYLLLGEAFHWAHVAGIALVLAGLAAVARSGASVH